MVLHLVLDQRGRGFFGLLPRAAMPPLDDINMFARRKIVLEKCSQLLD